MALVICAAIAVAARAEPGRYLELDAFLGSVFGAVPVESRTLFVDAELRMELEKIFEHRFARLRMRYWQEDGTSAWVLDEIGKTEPITIGIAVRDGRVASVRVLEFRETRGWEIRFPFFTEQFVGAGLVSGNEIDRHIDGITGATLSVTAAKKVVRAALLLHGQIETDSSSSS